MYTREGESETSMMKKKKRVKCAHEKEKRRKVKYFPSLYSNDFSPFFFLFLYMRVKQKESERKRERERKVQQVGDANNSLVLVNNEENQKGKFKYNF